MFRLNINILNLKSAIRPNAEFARVVCLYNLNFGEYNLQCMFRLNIVILNLKSAIRPNAEYIFA